MQLNAYEIFFLNYGWKIISELACKCFATEIYCLQFEGKNRYLQQYLICTRGRNKLLLPHDIYTEINLLSATLQGNLPLNFFHIGCKDETKVQLWFLYQWIECGSALNFDVLFNSLTALYFIPWLQYLGQDDMPLHPTLTHLTCKMIYSSHQQTFNTILWRFKRF